MKSDNGSIAKNSYNYFIDFETLYFNESGEFFYFMLKAREA